MKEETPPYVVRLAAGEPLWLFQKCGQGRPEFAYGLGSNKKENDKKENFSDTVFISFGSDGMDNSDAAGAVVDKNTIEKAKKLNLDANDYSNRFDSYNFFQKTGDLIFTGPTGANVSDLMILLTKNEK